MRPSEIIEKIKDRSADETIASLYGADNVEKQRARWLSCAQAFAGRFPDNDGAMMFSVPGRSEICGNHTDHNHGCVVAAAIDLDVIGVAAPNGTDEVRLYSQGYDGAFASVKALDPSRVRRGTPASLIAGVCKAFENDGYKIGGFDACCTSDVLTGSGLSSSAAFEVFVGTVLNHLFNGGRVDAITVARDAQYAENVFFGKPCGLMDQTACSVGGFVFIDFADPSAPVVRKLSRTLGSFGYALCITDTGGSHADLTDDYASIPAEMKSVAACLGAKVLRDADEGEFYKKIPELRASCGDRAVLRAIHFFNENRRAAAAADAMDAGDINAFLAVIGASGDSSFKYLQNIYTVKNVAEQGLSLALALGGGEVCRVHGGGFGGTVQAFVPTGRTSDYVNRLESAFGNGKCRILSVRAQGAVRVI